MQRWAAIFTRGKELASSSRYSLRKLPQVNLENELGKCSDSFLKVIEDLRVDFSKDHYNRIFNRILYWKNKLEDMVMTKLE